MATLTNAMVTTTLELPGQKIVRNLGVVRGIVVRSRSIVGNIGAAAEPRRRQHHAVHRIVREGAR